MKQSKPLEVYIFYIAAGLSTIIAILDLFDALDQVAWLSDRIPTLTLLLVGGLLAYVTSVMRDELNAIKLGLRDLQAQAQQEVGEKIMGLRKQIDPNLEVVFGEHISDLLSTLERTVKEQTIHLDDVDLFRYFYKRTLEKYPRSLFLATSLPYQTYFWKNQPMEEAMSRFIANRGKIKRIFFLRNMEELENEEVQEVLKSQDKIGIEVYVTDASKVPTHLKRFFVVETKGQIAWEVFVGPGNEIVNIIATSDNEATNKYNRTFKELFELNGTRRYVVPASTEERVTVT